MTFRLKEGQLKFFTRGWTHGDMTDEEAEAVAPAYWRYIESLDLPAPLQELAHLNPHDAFILQIEHDSARRTLCIRLHCGDLQVGYSDATLNFADVTIQPGHFSMLFEAVRPSEYEILYDEVERVDVDTFAYRLLLHPVGEIGFQFRRVAIVKQPKADRLTE